MAAFLDPLYAGETIGPVILVTGLLGGGAAWLAGRAIAATWRSPWQVLVAMLALAAAARFIHFALFQGNILSLTSYLCDFGFFVVMAFIAFRATRTAQMVRQYPWLYVRSGPLSWRKIGQEDAL
ncbi:MAG TPA: hypothetical protein VGJ20_19545 [Xanthobacteraceae bacterium]